MKYPLCRPHIGTEEKKLVNEVLDSGFLSLGPKLKEFETKFAQTIGTKYAIAVNSGTSGLHLCMKAIGLEEGDEVITSPLSFIASANCILYEKGIPVFIDIDPRTYNFDASKIEEKITAKTKAILPVHIFGQSCEMDQIMKLAEKYNLRIIEDACESIMATHQEQKVGTFGDAAVFAFYPNKQITTGEGGMIVTNDEKIKNTVDSLRNQGRNDSGAWLTHNILGYNYRLDEMSCAVGIAQLEKINFLIAERQKIAQMYNTFFQDKKSIITPFIHPQNTHTYFTYVVQLPEEIDRDEVIRKLLEIEIQTKPYLPAIHLQKLYREKFNSHEGDFPSCEKASKSLIALPLYVGLEKDDVLAIGTSLMSVLAKLS